VNSSFIVYRSSFQGITMNLSMLGYLFGRAPISTMGFSGAVASSSVHLKGAGGEAGDGFPLPRSGVLTGLQVWDGSTLRFDTDEISCSGGDRLSIFCQNAGTDFNVTVRVNGASTSLQAAGVPYNSTLYVVVEFTLLRS
jgi:hypothetical protein